MAETNERIPPQAIEAEQSVLGSILQNTEALHVGMEMLKDDYFYLPKHRKIFAAIRKVYEDSNAIDLLTVPDELFKRGQLDEVGGRRYLMDLTDTVVNFDNIEDHARIVIEAAVKNHLINDCSHIISRCYDPGNNADDLLDYAERKIFAIKEDSLKGDFVALRNILPQTFEQIEEYAKREGHVTGLSTGYPDLDSLTAGFQKSDLIIIAGRPSMGKAQPLDAKVLMCDGRWKEMGLLCVGDELASVDGRRSQVVGIYPQGARQVYRMIFADGRATECCAEHLWRIRYRSWTEPRILTTAQLMELLLRKRYRNRLWIEPFVGEFGSDEHLSLDPWLLGLLLGDGSLSGTSLRFSTAEPTMLPRMEQAVGVEMGVTPAGGYDYRIIQREGAHRKGTQGVSANPVTAMLREMGLWGHSAETKFIPTAYLSASREARTQLLAGLLDSDGWVEKFGSLRFATCSSQLAKDVVDLTRSLGGTASFCPKSTSYSYQRRKRSGQTSYVCNIQLPDPTILQLVKHKKDRLNARQRKRRLNIKAITATRIVKTQCIAVSHPSHLYVTDDYIVTHNTAFALNIAENVAVNRGIPVIIFSLEMAKEQLAQRLLCSRARISSHQMRTGRIADHQWTNLSIAVGPLSEAPIFLDDSATLTVMEIRAKARRMKLKYDIGLILLDYIQLVRGQKNPESRQQEITYISQSLKALARELKVPVVALSQLSRQVEQRGVKARPQLSDLRESGALEQDADVVLFIHRERDDDGSLGPVAEIIIGKQRNGPTGVITLHFVKDYARFELTDIFRGSPYPGGTP